MDRRLADRLRTHGIEVLTAIDAGTLGLDDEAQLRFAAEQGLPIVSHNQRHFQRWHDRFTSAGRQHAGILLVPAGPLRLVELRVAMLVIWAEMTDTPLRGLYRWHVLQGLMTQGYRMEAFTEAEARQALAIDTLGQ
jgi:hypothetical protein